ncbi:MAG: OmpA family protein [Pseudomonadales bacterium]|nr:OmpA family protein [Pseudomonadales bacterium]
MKPKSLAVAITLAGLTVVGSISPALADSSKEQKRSAVSGLVIGAAAGGPIGAFTGAVLGAEIFGKLFEQRRVNNELTVHVADLTGKLNASQTSHAQKDQVITALNQDLDKVLYIQSSAPKSQQLPVQFRTASDVLEPQYEAELKQIANVLRRNQDATVRLSGFADRRGDDQFNQALSEQRVRSVKRFLVNSGVNSTQVIGAAFGETRPLDSAESLESNFFDRRVVVELKLEIDRKIATR